MTESLMGFTLGFAVVMLAVGAWKLQGWAKERARMIENHTVQLKELAASFQLLESLYAGINRQLAEVRGMPHTASGASDAAIAQLSGRLGKLEKAQAEADLTILDTVEKVAHRLQDRRRKRDNAELDQGADVPLDPAQLLAEARRAYGVMTTAPDPQQLSLNGVEQ